MLDVRSPQPDPVWTVPYPPPGKVLVDADFIHEAKRLFRRAEDRLPLGAKLNADIASWIDRAKALFPSE